jgi:hypothetical protein
MLKHKWNPETMRSGFYAMLQHAELQEIEHETDVVLGSYWSGIKDACWLQWTYWVKIPTILRMLGGGD